MKAPLISVIVTTHDRPDTLLRTLKSIVREVRVSREIIIVSDRMDPNRISGIAEFLGAEDSVLFLPNLKGPAETRNLGIQLSRGEFLVLFEDDDELPDFDRHYGRVIATALSNRGGVTFSNVEIKEEDRSKEGFPCSNSYLLSFKERNVDEIYIKNFIITPACVIPSHIARQCQQDKYLRSLEDWDFLLNLYSRCDFHHVDEIGAIIYKDFVNDGVRRSTTSVAKGAEIVNDYLYIYRRWPAPSEEIRQVRATLLRNHGLNIEATLL
jgi:GalNAc5-diNAcBac-PP-undecaprenol beta-1,3-glucosyltransferase